jgi:histidine ammonia-lyase
MTKEIFMMRSGEVTLKEWEHLWRHGIMIEIDPSAKDRVDQAAKIVANAADGDVPVYGINTGFGKLASVTINSDEVKTLQRNLILSHCAGVGDHLEETSTRLMMMLKINSLARGASGVRWETIIMLQNMLAEGVIPIILEQGSVGASGDLAPLAHMSAVLIGEGEAYYKGKRMSGGEALQKAGLNPLTLAPKEGLALINGTQFSTAMAMIGLWKTQQLVKTAIISGALTTDAIMGSTSPTLPGIHALRGLKGQINVAAESRRLLAGSEIRESHRNDDHRVQDPYCIRCQPQVLGAAVDILNSAAATLAIESNAVTDNPIVLVEEGLIVSGGNFHAEPVAFAADQIALAIAEIGAICQRRIALMVDPNLSFHLPPFLTAKPGLNSGFMIAEVTSAALMSENRHLANPCSTDSTPTSANQEDHVSMAAHAAVRLMRMSKNLRHIIAIEILAAAQGIHFRKPLKTSPILSAVITIVRKHISVLDDDRYMAEDINIMAELIKNGCLVSEAGMEGFFDSAASN